MKKTQLKALLGLTGITLSLSTKVCAQTNTGHNDTIYMSFESGEKILLIGDDLLLMREYGKADSVKTLFITDWAKALDEKQINYDIQLLHYFVHETGKRRLKAEDITYTNQTINIDAEITRLNLDLPKYCYKLYDIQTGYHIEIYTDNPKELKKMLETTSLDLAVKQGVPNKKTARQNYRVDLQKKEDDFSLQKKHTNTQTSFELSPIFGLTLVGHTPSPTLGAQTYFSFYNKYGTGFFRAGLSYNVVPFINMFDGKITGESLLSNYDVRFMFNVLSDSPQHKASWLGLSVGYVSNSGDPNPLHKATKLGILYNNGGHFSYGYDLYKTTDKKNVHGFTITYTF